VLVVPPQLGPRTLKDFVDFARARGDVNWSHAGIGSSTHLVGEKFMLEAKLSHTGIPYKGAPEALTDTIGMRVALFFAAVGHAAPFVNDGRVLALAVTGKERSPAIPNVPTVAETMLPGFEYDVWFLVAAPAKTPKAVVDRLSADIRLGLGAADFRSVLDAMGAVGRPTTPEAAQAYALKEFETLGKVIKAARVPVN
jgi:tripartite-type tricarboxylate transporter receptor subunit TctC